MTFDTTQVHNTEPKKYPFADNLNYHFLNGQTMNTEIIYDWNVRDNDLPG